MGGTSLDTVHELFPGPCLLIFDPSTNRKIQNWIETLIADKICLYSDTNYRNDWKHYDQVELQAGHSQIQIMQCWTKDWNWEDIHTSSDGTVRRTS